MSVKINKKQSGLYAIDGELNIQTVPGISKQLPELIAGLKEESLTFDLASVSRSDSAGVALLIELMQLAKMANLKLNFSHLPQQMKDIAGVSGLLDILPISEN